MTTEQKGLLFAGDMFISIADDAGVFGSFFQVETDKLEITTPSEFKEKASKGRTTYGQNFVSQPVAKPSEFAVTFSEVTRQVFAMQLSGKLSALTIAGGAFSGTAVTVVKGSWVETGLENVAEAGFTVQDVTDTTTYDAAAGDYEWNPRLGLLKIPDDSPIADAAILHLSGTESAVSGQRIEGATRYKTVMRFRLDGINLVTNEDVLLFADRAVVASDAAYDFLQADVAEAPLKGKLEIPATGKPPFTLDFRTTA